MGTDNLFHKRKAKLANNLKRNKAKREIYDKALIVCEGEKTEPNYFNELIDQYEINSANVAIDGTCGSSPKSVLSRARTLVEKEEKKGDPFDRIFCIFDKDSHASYNETLDNIQKINSETTKIKCGTDNKQSTTRFTAIHSTPCFEYWLLLHFIYSTKPFAATGSKSICDEVINELVKYIPEYSKGKVNVFSELFDQLELAKNNAIRANKSAKENHTDNPTTLVHELVDYLQKIKETK